MRDEFVKYLTSLGMGDVLLGRVTYLERSIAAVCPEELKYVFADDIVQQDGSRQYQGLFFFSDNYAIAASNFVSQDRFEMDEIGNSIVYLEFDSSEFDFKAPTEKSRLRVRYVTGTQLQAYMSASQENCMHLLEIVRSCLVPNFVRQSK